MHRVRSDNYKQHKAEEEQMGSFMPLDLAGSLKVEFWHQVLVSQTLLDSRSNLRRSCSHCVDTATIYSSFSSLETLV